MFLTHAHARYALRVLWGGALVIVVALSDPSLVRGGAIAQNRPTQAIIPTSADNSLPPACGLKSFKTLRIEKVIDAENLLLSDGSEYRTGVLASDLDDPAAGDALSRLVGVPIAVYQVRGNPPDPDRYGRIGGPAVIQSSTGREWLQANLIANGLARVVPGNPPRACTEALLALENKARQNQMGHWQSGIFTVLEASNTQKILRDVTRFAIVEGTVVRSSKSRGSVYLNFGRDWKKDFTVNIPKRLVSDLKGQQPTPAPDPGTTLYDPDDLPKPGSRIRVRGWIEDRSGPMIKVESLDQIEAIDQQPEQPPE